MTPQPPIQSIQQRRNAYGPNTSALFRRWQALEPVANPTRITMNGGDVSEIIPINGSGAAVAADKLTQATGAKQALLNTTDADFNGKPTIEFAGAEVYTTPSAISLPSTCTIVVVGQDQGGGAFRSINELYQYYSESNGGFILYTTSSFLTAGYHYTAASSKQIATPGGSPAGRFIWIVSFDPSAAGLSQLPRAVVNGTNMSNGTSGGAAGSFRSSRLMLGGRESLGSQYWIGPWCATSIYSGTFTAQQAADERAYWQAEYGL